MKKQVAILLLVCYSIVLFRPLAPCISDFLAHSFWETEHLATVHFENGKYHVHLEMEKAGKENPVKSESSGENLNISPDFFPVASTAETRSFDFISFHFPELKNNLPGGFYSVTSPPPRSC